jgi:hypothetical protein
MLPPLLVTLTMTLTMTVTQTHQGTSEITSDGSGNSGSDTNARESVFSISREPNPNPNPNPRPRPILPESKPSPDPSTNTYSDKFPDSESSIHRNSHISEIFRSNFQSYANLVILLKSYFFKAIQEMKNTFQDVFNCPPLGAFLGVLFFSALYYGIFQLALKDSISFKLMKHLVNNEQKVKERRRLRLLSTRNSKLSGDSGEFKGSYVLNEDDDEFENLSLKEVINKKITKIWNFFIQKKDEYNREKDEDQLPKIFEPGDSYPGDNGNMKLKNFERMIFYTSLAQAPLNLILVVGESFLSSLYLLFCTVYIFNFIEDKALKFNLILPFVTTWFFMVVEVYLRQVMVRVREGISEG